MLATPKARARRSTSTGKRSNMALGAWVYANAIKRLASVAGEIIEEPSLTVERIAQTIHLWSRGLPKGPAAGPGYVSEGPRCVHPGNHAIACESWRPRAGVEPLPHRQR